MEPVLWPLEVDSDSALGRAEGLGIAAAAGSDGCVSASWSSSESRTTRGMLAHDGLGPKLQRMWGREVCVCKTTCWDDARRGYAWKTPEHVQTGSHSGTSEVKAMVLAFAASGLGASASSGCNVVGVEGTCQK